MLGSFFYELMLFAGKALLVLITISVVLALTFALARKGKNAAGSTNQPRLVIKDLTHELSKQRKALKQAIKKADPDRKLKKEAAAAASKGWFSWLKKRSNSKAKAETKTELKQNVCAAENTTTVQDDVKVAAARVDNVGENVPTAEKTDNLSVHDGEAAADKTGNSAETGPIADTVEHTALTDKSAITQLQRRQQARQRKLDKLHALEDKGEFCPRNLFVLTFKGSVKGSEVKRLRREIDVLVQVADKRDEVIIKLTSPGGMVNSYGLLSSQLLRLRDRGIFLTVCVDSVAASGGYLMACVANKIVAAPFAYIGSIGVVAEFPNFHRLLNSHEVDYEQVTAGKYKRTLSMLGPNTDEAREKFKQELEAIHRRFKEQVLKFRPQLNADKVATGEHWLAIDALELGLVDELATSEEYIAKRADCTYCSVLALALVKKPKPGMQSLLRRLSLLRLFSTKSALQDKLQQAALMEHIH